MKYINLVLVALLMVVAGCESTEKDSGSATNSSGSKGEKVKIAYVTNGIAEFWNIAKAGAMAAEKEFGCEVKVVMPVAEGGRVANQNAEIQKLLADNYKGIAVSPIDPSNQNSILNEVGDNAEFITHDSDAPDSNRKLFIGMSNYDAGFMVADLVKKAIPDGGNIVIFVGSVDQLNGRQRRQGVIDGLLGREKDPNRMDPIDNEQKGDKYTVLATYVDNFDEALKSAQPEQALAKYEKIDCMIGLFEYNPPKIFSALKSADKLGKIKVIGFDENVETLQQIRDGNCEATLVQNPYEYGYQSVKVLYHLLNGDESDLNDAKYLDVPARVIDKSNVDEFEKDLNEKKAAGK